MAGGWPLVCLFVQQEALLSDKAERTKNFLLLVIIDYVDLSNDPKYERFIVSPICDIAVCNCRYLLYQLGSLQKTWVYIHDWIYIDIWLQIKRYSSIHGYPYGYVYGYPCFL